MQFTEVNQKQVSHNSMLFTEIDQLQ